jgi:hypothetical protein
VDILTLVRKEQNCVEVGKMHSEEWIFYLKIANKEKEIGASFAVIKLQKL